MASGRDAPLQTCIYRGSTTHTRRKPWFNRFRYGIYMAYIDLEELESGVLESWPLFSSGTGWAVTSVLCRDHMVNESGGRGLLTRVRDVVERETGVRPRGAVRLLTNLRVLGVEFNPISVYYVFDETGLRVETVVAEVSNFPWFEQHNYVIRPVEGVAEAEGVMRKFTTHDKSFHVSPFMDVRDVQYEWLVSEPGERVRLRIGVSDREGGFFMAGMEGTRVEWGAWRLVQMQVVHPMHSLVVMAGILFESGRLFRRGLRFFPHPTGAESWLSRAIFVVVSALMVVVNGMRRAFGQGRVAGG